MMVERGGVTVDWFEGRGGGGGEGEEEGVEEGMEMEVSRRRGEEWMGNGEDEDDEEEGRRKRKRGMMMLRSKEEHEEHEEHEEGEEDAEETMLELRLSLAVAISVPSPHQQQTAAAGSFVVHQHQHNHPQNHYNQLHHHQNNHHHHHHQQLATTLGGRHQSPVKQLLQRPSSPLENHRGSSRANLTASLKHLVCQQQPVKVKSVPRIPVALSTSRQPPEYGAALLAQSPLPQPPLVRASSSHTLQEGQDTGAFFQGIGRLPSSAQASVQFSSSSIGMIGQRQQTGYLNPTHESIFQKGFPQHNQPRHSAHRVFSRSASTGLVQQSPKDVCHPGQPGSLGQGTVASFPHSRIFPAHSFTSHIPAQAKNIPVSGPQLQTFLQHQASNAVSVASHRQTQPLSQSMVSTLCKNPSAVSLVRPFISGAVSTSVGDIPPRERSGESHIIVNVCDRKVRLTSELDTTSLYALCRRWVRNDVPRKDQTVLWDSQPFPRPLAISEAGASNCEPGESSKQEESTTVSKTMSPGSIESFSEKDLLLDHVEHFKRIRKRFRDGRKQRIARFMPRLALLLPENAENNRRDALLDQLHPVL